MEMIRKYENKRKKRKNLAKSGGKNKSRKYRQIPFLNLTRVAATKTHPVH
jgi:hypothetical protein